MLCYDQSRVDRSFSSVSQDRERCCGEHDPVVSARSGNVPNTPGRHRSHKSSAGECFRVFKIPVPAQIEATLRDQSFRGSPRSTPIPDARKGCGRESHSGRRTATLVEAAAQCLGFRGSRQVTGVARRYDGEGCSGSSNARSALRHGIAHFGTHWLDRRWDQYGSGFCPVHREGNEGAYCAFRGIRIRSGFSIPSPTACPETDKLFVSE